MRRGGKVVTPTVRTLARAALLVAGLLASALAALGATGRLDGVLGRDPLPVYGAAPAFALVDQAGRPVGDGDVRGRVVVANFIYTSCPDVCPVLSSRMAALAARLRDERLLGARVQLLSFSVDPEHDTPEVLRAYAARFGADGASWRFLTGEAPAVRSLLVQGFKVPAQPVALEPAAAAHAHHHAGRAEAAAVTVLHSNTLVVVDPKGRVRGYYDGLALDLEALLRDLRRLAA